jgi:hypothetical protein
MTRVMREKLTKDEKDRIAMHRKVAKSLPRKRQVRSLEGQKYFDFESVGRSPRSERAGQRVENVADDQAERGVARGIERTRTEPEAASVQILGAWAVGGAGWEVSGQAVAGCA